jgi:Protein of unknown function (DUF1572)
MLPFYEVLAERFHDLHEEIRNDLSSLPPEALDWVPGHEMNSVSVIITHLTGAERFLIGDVIMQDPSNRNRDAEFLVKGLTKMDLMHRLDETETYSIKAFEKLTMEDLSTERLHPRHGNQVKVAWAILHALDHVASHVGHINITAQLWHQRTIGG